MDIKDIVRAKYNQIALQSKTENEKSYCGATGCCDSVDYTVFSEDYSDQQGYHEDADLGLGCGIPTQFAGIKPGDTVLDLGSGAGNDAFVARAMTGEEGEVIGLDFAGAMLMKARQNASKLGFSNVRFVKGDIEAMPLPDGIADVVLSNCVLNLVPDKMKAFSEIFRVLKPGGHFCISDVVISGVLPESLQKSAEMYAGCISGAIARDAYLSIIGAAGFNPVSIEKEKQITIPDDTLLQYMSTEELASHKAGNSGIFSITVTGIKPA
jgi:arsenite methyltransferase